MGAVPTANDKRETGVAETRGTSTHIAACASKHVSLMEWTRVRQDVSRPYSASKALQTPSLAQSFATHPQSVPHEYTHNGVH